MSRLIDADEVIRVIDNQPTVEVNQWIKCEDRLPEDNQEVLVAKQSENGRCLMYIGYYDSKIPQWYHNYRGYHLNNVVAWQPLPSAYREEKQ